MLKTKGFLRECLRRVSRFRMGQVIILWSFDHLSTIFPIQRLRETDTLIAFHYPEPAYPVHILIMPKQPIAKFMDLFPTDDGLIMEVVLMVQSLVEELHLKDAGYHLIVNGGKYQNLPRLHFHLILGDLVG